MCNTLIYPGCPTCAQYGIMRKVGASITHVLGKEPSIGTNLDGALATAGALRDLSLRLVELHGQHEHQALLDPATHIPLLDTFAKLDDPASRTASAWSDVRVLRDQLDRSRMDAREKSARLDLIAFQLGEIEKASPKAGEDEELSATRQVLASAERLQRLCSEGYAALYEDDGAVLAGLGGVWRRVGDPELAQHLSKKGREGRGIELDLVRTPDHSGHGPVVDTGRLGIHATDIPANRRHVFNLLVSERPL